MPIGFVFPTTISEALTRVRGTLHGLLRFFEVFPTDDTEKVKTKLRSLVDMSMGDVLPFNDAQFEKFIAKEGEDPLEKALLEYRKTMLEKVDAILSEEE